MTLPEEYQWQRVEEIASELEKLAPSEAARRMAQLEEQGETRTILSLVGNWLSLPAPPTPLRAGDPIGRSYVLCEKIGEGGMGEVWRATQTMIKRDDALKMIHPALIAPALCARFAGETEVLGRLQHPGIVGIHSAEIHVREDGVAIPFYAMELIDGEPLNRWAEVHREDHVGLLRIMAEVCAAVQHAHDRQIIHRDLKPANILVRKDGHPVVLDFGISRIAGQTGDAPGEFSGTPHYSAPEQHEGRDRDFRSGESVDVYAIGAILFEILTGRRLHHFPRGTPIAEMRRQIIEGRPRRIAEEWPDCPPPLDEIAARAVRRNPADRYYSVAALGRALSRVAATLTPSPAVNPEPWFPAAGAVIPGTEWRLAEKLGEGGAGEVWAGKNETLGETRVFKFCDTEEKARTLKRELTLYRLLKERVGRNPHFIPLHDVSLDEPPWYLMMEHVDARDLENWCAAQPGGLAQFSVETRVEIVAQVAEALQAAHEAGILHRDIKPENILVRETSNSTSNDNAAPSGPQPIHVYIADFGIGQLTVEELSQSGTLGGFTFTVSDLRRSTLAGTMMYLAPEVMEGNPATARSDIYGLGVILWQLLIGNLRAALDPADWPSRISDPLLREDLQRCLAGSPEKRWTSAGDLAASLRALPGRRVQEVRRQEEIVERERAAYRRGVFRTAAIAALLVMSVSALALVAWSKTKEARLTRAHGALEQAEGITQLTAMGRRPKGLALVEEACAFPDAPARIRTVAASLLALTDFQAVDEPVAQDSASQVNQGTEAVSLISPSGKLAAQGRALDDVQGVVDIVETKEGKARVTFRRKDFPWVPIPEAGFLQFSPKEDFLAVAGPETSRHILLCDTEQGRLQSYIFAPEGLRSLAWHPGNRLLATGGENRSVQIWDICSARIPQSVGAPEKDFSLPPALSDPAIDQPLVELPGWRDSVRSLSFDPSGMWLAALDEAGWLRVWRGFTPEGLPGLPPPAEARSTLPGLSISRPVLQFETRLNRSRADGQVTLKNGKIIVSYPGQSPQAFALTPGIIFREAWIAPGLRNIAWSEDGTQLCAITDADIYWIARESLAITCRSRGANPTGVAYDGLTRHWVLPTADEFVERWPAPSASVTSRETPSGERYKFLSAQERQGARVGLSAWGSGKMAVYHGNLLQFFADGKPDDSMPAITVEPGGQFQDVVCDHSGRLVTVVFSANGTLRAQSFSLPAGGAGRLPKIDSLAQRLVPAEDGVHLIERGINIGISRVDAKSGSKQSLDMSDAARQNAPLAVSTDGKWIAAVTDQRIVRLYNAMTGAYYADLITPRETRILFLAWHPSGDWLAALTEDGYVQVWSLTPWREWIAKHKLNG